MLITGNTYFDFNLKEFIANYKASKYDSMLMLKQVENPWEHEGAIIKDGKLAGLMEKHKSPGCNKAVSGIYIFSPLIFKAVSRIRPSSKGEYNLINAVQYLIEKEYNVGYMEITDYCINIKGQKDILDFNRYILSEKDKKNVTGFESRIISSKISDYTSIGKRCIIKDSYIYNSIIMDDCIISGVEIYDSIVCNYSIIAGKGSLNGIFAEKTKLYLNSSVIEQNTGIQ
jgi:glucose-1-phosphate thymidylyltransferase